MSNTEKTIKIEQTGSPIRRHHTQRKTLIGLGLNRIGRVAQVPDTPAVRGMLAKVKHLVRILESSQVGKGKGAGRAANERITG
jgi:large subunit ribosomal protein L30